MVSSRAATWRRATRSAHTESCRPGHSRSCRLHRSGRLRVARVRQRPRRRAGRAGGPHGLDGARLRARRARGVVAPAGPVRPAHGRRRIRHLPVEPVVVERSPCSSRSGSCSTSSPAVLFLHVFLAFPTGRLDRDSKRAGRRRVRDRFRSCSSSRWRSTVRPRQPPVGRIRARWRRSRWRNVQLVVLAACRAGGNRGARRAPARYGPPASAVARTARSIPSRSDF